MKTSHVLLTLLVVALGVEIGAGVYEMRVLVPLWSAAPPASLVAYNLQPLRPNPGPDFWMVWTPLVGLLSLANLIVALRSREAVRKWWVLGAALALAVVVVTFVYFVPAIMRFQSVAQAVTTADTAQQVRQWVTLNWVRAAVYIVAWLSLLRAFRGSNADHPAT